MDSSHLRSKPAMLLISAALLTSLLLGIAFVIAHRVFDLRGEAFQSAAPVLTEDQSRRQVLDSARAFVAAGALRSANGSYLLQSCGSDDRPQYRGSVHLNFQLPTIAETPNYFREIARGMKERGWREGLPPGRHPGGWTLARDGQVAVYYRDLDVPRRGILQIDGECRDVADHQSDNGDIIRITDELYG